MSKSAAEKGRGGEVVGSKCYDEAFKASRVHNLVENLPELY